MGRGPWLVAHPDNGHPKLFGLGGNGRSYKPQSNYQNRFATQREPRQLPPLFLPLLGDVVVVAKVEQQNGPHHRFHHCVSHDARGVGNDEVGLVERQQVVKAGTADLYPVCLGGENDLALGFVGNGGVFPAKNDLGTQTGGGGNGRFILDTRLYH